MLSTIFITSTFTKSINFLVSLENHHHRLLVKLDMMMEVVWMACQEMLMTKMTKIWLGRRQHN
jgi:hypothetical protein